MSVQEKPAVVLLTTGGPLPNVVTNNLAGHVEHLVVLREDGVSKKALFKSRAKLLGSLKAMGQVAAGYLFKVVRRMSRSRIRGIEAEAGLDRQDRGQVETIEIGSVNSAICREELKRLNPEVIAVFSTRIIKKETLNAVPAPFINYHAGINPAYRGQDPGYWALVEGDLDHAGVTIHLIDEGVDTGDVLYQAKVDFQKGGNITTYQHQQMVVALPLLRQTIDDALSGRLAPKKVDLPSCQWFPPTLWAYLWYGISRGVW